MGATGPAIFSDDTTADIRTTYRDLLEDQVPDDEATRQVIARYQAELPADEAHLLWLALAATQTKLGRLDEDVRARALHVIDKGEGLHLWVEAGPRQLAKRQAVLAALRDQLTGPQPPRRPLRRPPRIVTDLNPGDVLSFTSASGRMALLKVARIDDHGMGDLPILQRLDWTGRKPPASWRLQWLRARPASGPPHNRTNTVYCIVRAKPGALWRDTGFTLLDQLPPRRGDERVQPGLYTDWTRLGEELQRELGAGTERTETHERRAARPSTARQSRGDRHRDRQD